VLLGYLQLLHHDPSLRACRSANTLHVAQALPRRVAHVQVLQEQLKAREEARAREAEERARERTVMLRETERLKEEELRAKVEKQLKARQLISEARALSELCWPKLCCAVWEQWHVSAS
jgi:hypothetical protein